MIDWKRLGQLQAEVGREEFRPVLELFLDEMEEVLMRLGGEGPGLLAGQMSFLQGGARNVGLRAFAALCEASEARAMAGGAADVDVAALIDCYAQSKRRLIRELGGRVAGEDVA